MFELGLAAPTRRRVTMAGRAEGEVGFIMEPVSEPLAEAECLRLISPGGIGRLAYSSPAGPVVLPVTYRLYEGTIVFRTGQNSPVGEDLRTGIAGAEYKVAFEIDRLPMPGPEGWFVFIHGAAHHVDSDAERASVLQAGVEPWPTGAREHFVRIIPTLITGRRIGPAANVADE
jgi:nitroimidazol reductase NimA-like FMN-containing flavoprotein (pyridoxamine 5'-phosphate oxidase superfamily)